MKKVYAKIKLFIDVECPHCEETIDLTSIQSLCDDGYIYSRALGDGQWGCTGFNEKVECPDCHEEFIVENIIY